MSTALGRPRVTVSQVTDATIAGRALLTATNDAAQRALLNVAGRGTDQFWGVGDSLIAGYLVADGSKPTDVVQAAQPTWEVQNKGVSTYTIAQTQALVLADVIPFVDARRQKTVVAVWCGTNNVLAGATGAEAWTEYATLCGLLRAAGIKVEVIPIIPRGEFNSTMRTHAASFNALAAANWATVGDVYVDLLAHPYFSNPLVTNTAGYNADGTHLNATGSAVVGNLFASAAAGLSASEPSLDVSQFWLQRINNQSTTSGVATKVAWDKVVYASKGISVDGNGNITLTGGNWNLNVMVRLFDVGATNMTLTVKRGSTIVLDYLIPHAGGNNTLFAHGPITASAGDTLSVEVLHSGATGNRLIQGVGYMTYIQGSCLP